MQTASLTLKLKKCFIISDAINYLEHVFTPVRLQIRTKATETVHEFNELTTASNLRSLSELCSVYLLFFPNFARVSELLSKRLQNGEPTRFELKDKQRLTVDDSK